MKRLLLTWAFSSALGAVVAGAVYSMLGPLAAFVWLGACIGAVQWAEWWNRFPRGGRR